MDQSVLGLAYAVTGCQHVRQSIWMNKGIQQENVIRRKWVKCVGDFSFVL